MVNRLDKGHYSDNDLVEVKLPLKLLYASNWSQYERYDGEIEMRGVHYNYVKRKFANDTLYLMCIRNKDNTNLVLAKNKYFNNINDASGIPGKKEKSPGSIIKAFSAEYNAVAAAYHLSVPYMVAVRQYLHHASRLSSCFLPTLIEPPQA